jgi:putative oxidoreductase
MTLLLIAARVLFSMLFLLAGANHLIHRREAIAQAAHEGMPMPNVFIDGATVTLLVGGASVLLGAWARIGAAILALFLVSAAMVAHAFWRVREPKAAELQRVQFMKNLALTGGALMFVYFGSGPFSLAP